MVTEMITNAYEDRQRQEAYEKVFNFNGNPISMKLVNGNVFVCLTEMSKVFPKKNLAHIVQSKEMQEYIAALSKIQNCILGDLLIVKHGGSDGEHGTWAYSKIALRVAQKLSPEFAVWVDTKIEELFTYGKAEIPNYKPQEPTLAERTAAAQLLTSIAHNSTFPDKYKEIVDTEAVNMISAKELLPMPVSDKQLKRVTATQMGFIVSRELGLTKPITPQTIGNLSTDYNLKRDDTGVFVEILTKNGGQKQGFEYFDTAIPLFVEAAKDYMEKNPKCALTKLVKKDED